MNAVDLCNLALGRIGQGASNPIAALTESSDAARACARLLAPTMAALLRETIDWPFATAAVALQPVTQVVPGWAYVYAYPDGCERVRALAAANVDPLRAAQVGAPVPYRLLAASNGESLVLATDLPDAWAWYTRAVTRPEFADPLFQDALAWRLAMELALTLKADPRLWQSASNGYRQALSAAGAAAGNEQGVEPPADAASITVR